MTRESILERIEPIEDGDIVCMHLRNTETVEALEILIPKLKAEGFSFRDMSTLEP